jgi:N-acetylneuraminate synthase/N,N'-diacetyllegionaminate synthase
LKKTEIKFGNKKIGGKQPVFVVAEAGVNHNGSLKIAKRLIKEAKNCGADAVKFQTFKAIDLASKKSKWFNIFKKLELEDQEFEELNDYAKQNDILFFSSPFSFDAVDLLTKFKVKAIKIASGDLTNIPLIKYAASKKKTMIVSTGMGNFIEIIEAVKTIKSVKNKNIILMHSVSSYPTPIEDVNLNSISLLEKKFSLPVGYSDNGDNMVVPIVAVSLGAKIIEKHFTINKNMKGPDHHMSADPKQFKKLVDEIHEIEKMLGDGIKKCQKSELENRIGARRSITAKVDLFKNSRIIKQNITFKRPATGIQPKYFNEILGRKIKRKIKADDAIQWKDLRK